MVMNIFKRTRVSDLTGRLPPIEIRKRARILLIDDQPETFPLDMLRSEGYAIDHWGRVESLERIEQGYYDIVILDIRGVAQEISQRDGLGVLHAIKKANPSQVVVAFSGQRYSVDDMKFFKMADDVLKKPVTAVRCKMLIDDLLEQQFDIRRLWRSVERSLKHNGVPERVRRKLERRVVKAAKSKQEMTYSDVLAVGLEKGDLALRVAEWIIRLLALAAA